MLLSLLPRFFKITQSYFFYKHGRPWLMFWKKYHKCVYWCLTSRHFIGDVAVKLSSKDLLRHCLKWKRTNSIYLYHAFIFKFILKRLDHKKNAFTIYFNWHCFCLLYMWFVIYQLCIHINIYIYIYTYQPALFFYGITKFYFMMLKLLS